MGTNSKRQFAFVLEEPARGGEGNEGHAAAIKAYSSVIADAAEDSEPQTPVQYSAVIPDEEKKAPVQSLSQDPMGSMIQNEIVSIKDASIKAAADNSA